MVHYPFVNLFIVDLHTYGTDIFNFCESFRAFVIAYDKGL